MKINKNNMIITVDTELGSNGEAVARALSEQLHIPCYAGEILDKASELSGIPAALLHRYDGRAVRAAYDLLAEDTSALRLPPASDFITAQIMACRALAEQGSCILVDRHASMALEGREDLVRIFVHANFADRARSFASHMHIAVQSAEQKLKKADHAYRGYYRDNHKGWGAAENYDLSVNASDADVPAMAATVLGFLESLTGEKLAAHSESKAV